MANILNALREATGELHHQLDNEVMGGGITSRSGYLNFLMMHARILPAVERWLATREVYMQLSDAENRFRTDALKRDIEQMDATFPDEFDMSFLNDATSVLGISYVLEGSRLGGMKLSRIIEKSGSDYPVSFLKHGEGKSYWQNFLSWLETGANGTENAQQAADAASALFKAYLKSFNLCRES